MVLSRTTAAPPKRAPRCLWIGGTSGLARTYANAFFLPRAASQDDPPTAVSPADWLLVGHQPEPPAWLRADFGACDYQCVDFLKPHGAAWQRLAEDCRGVTHMVISIRPPLVSHRTFAQARREDERLLEGLQAFVHMLVQARSGDAPPTPLHILHVSSIAAIDHVQAQELRAETDAADPPSASLLHPYDRFKRACEEALDALVVAAASAVHVTHVRLGAFFSDDASCIQCQALALQARVGCYLPTRIDCNSARNVAVLLRAVLTETPPPNPTAPATIRYFFYTRPLSWERPRPYGDYLVAYRRAHEIRLALWIPVAIVRLVVALVHWIATQSWGRVLPFCQSVDYLLQVTRREHTFCLAAVQTAYPSVAAQEETLEDCFRRRQASVPR